MCYAVCLSYGCNFLWNKEVQNGVSTDWCVNVEHWELSSIEVVFIDY